MEEPASCIHAVDKFKNLELYQLSGDIDSSARFGKLFPGKMQILENCKSDGKQEKQYIKYTEDGDPENQSARMRRTTERQSEPIIMKSIVASPSYNKQYFTVQYHTENSDQKADFPGVFYIRKQQLQDIMGCSIYSVHSMYTHFKTVVGDDATLRRFKRSSNLEIDSTIIKRAKKEESKIAWTEFMYTNECMCHTKLMQSGRKCSSEIMCQEMPSTEVQRHVICLNELPWLCKNIIALIPSQYEFMEMISSTIPIIATMMTRQWQNEIGCLQRGLSLMVCIGKQQMHDVEIWNRCFSCPKCSRFEIFGGKQKSIVSFKRIRDFEDHASILRMAKRGKSMQGWTEFEDMDQDVSLRTLENNSKLANMCHEMVSNAACHSQQIGPFLVHLFQQKEDSVFWISDDIYLSLLKGKFGEEMKSKTAFLPPNAEWQCHKERSALLTNIVTLTDIAKEQIQHMHTWSHCTQLSECPCLITGRSFFLDKCQKVEVIKDKYEKIKFFGSHTFDDGAAHPKTPKHRISKEILRGFEHKNTASYDMVIETMKGYCNSIKQCQKSRSNLAFQKQEQVRAEKLNYHPQKISMHCISQRSTMEKVSGKQNALPIITCFPSICKSTPVEDFGTLESPGFYMQKCLYDTLLEHEVINRENTLLLSQMQIPLVLEECSIGNHGSYAERKIEKTVVKENLKPVVGNEFSTMSSDSNENERTVYSTESTTENLNDYEYPLEMDGLTKGCSENFVNHQWKPSQTEKRLETHKFWIIMRGPQKCLNKSLFRLQKNGCSEIALIDQTSEYDANRLVPSKIFHTSKVRKKFNNSSSKSSRRMGILQHKTFDSNFESPSDCGSTSRRSGVNFNLLSENLISDIANETNKDSVSALNGYQMLQCEVGSMEDAFTDLIINKNSLNLNGEPEKENNNLKDCWEQMEEVLQSGTAVYNTELSGEVNVPNSMVGVDVEEDEGINNICMNGHVIVLDEEIGNICKVCGYVEREIKHILPPFGIWRDKSYRNQSRTAYDVNGECNESILFLNELDGLPATEILNRSNGSESVWKLIREFQDTMETHQLRAFEFLWNNIAGGLVPEDMKLPCYDTGGCILAHAPGTGKSLTVISFLKSYISLFPRRRPLILAPKTMLQTWKQEFGKWNVNIPVHILYSVNDFNKKDCNVRKELLPQFTRPLRQAYTIYCLKTLLQWHKEESVLILAYPLFLTLTYTANDKVSEEGKQIAKCLTESPGILILDEGHIPRNHNSKIWNALMRVKTRYRILLTGTLFQNNFEEYFNSLCLARPNFVDRILESLGQEDTKQTKDIREKMARQYFIEEIANRMNSECRDQRDSGQMMLKFLTEGFIDVYEGDILNYKLPGLRVYTVMLKLTALQEKCLESILQTSERENFSFVEMELMISVASIHPCLLEDLAFVYKYKDMKKSNLGYCRNDPEQGIKLKFVIECIRICQIKGEKALIFSQHISPLLLLKENLEAEFQWCTGKEILLIEGSHTVAQRQNIIDKFNHGNACVLLASIKTTGVGINLTEASRVIFMDLLWNPSHTKQAIARAFRMGQKKHVSVYQLVADNTLEESKYETTVLKDKISSLIFDGEKEASKRTGDCISSLQIKDDILKQMVEQNRNMFSRIFKQENAAHRQETKPGGAGLSLGNQMLRV